LRARTAAHGHKPLQSDGVRRSPQAEATPATVVPVAVAPVAPLSPVGPGSLAPQLGEGRQRAAQAQALGPGVLVRADSGGASHDFLDRVVSRGFRFSVGFDLTEPVREAILTVPEQAWRPAQTQAGEPREGAAVAELALELEANGWPAGTRAICRRERPHPGAQLSFTDHNGYRFQVFITNQQGKRIERLEQLHRQHAVVEDRIRCGKDTGLRNLPFQKFAPNAAWLELALLGQDLLAWTQRLLLTGELARCEPKRLRYRLLHVAGRITRHARRVRLHLPRGWPWGEALLAAFERLRALPQPP